MYIVYWLISKNNSKTYIGFSNKIENRLNQHKNKQVKSTKDFGDFRCFKLEEVNNYLNARQREKYWKSCAGRKKLKQYFNVIKNNGPIV